MDEELRDPEIEKLLKEIKLQEPSEQEMADFVSGVHLKIAQGHGAPTVGFRQIGIVLVASIAFAGLVYFMYQLSSSQPVRLVPQNVVVTDRIPIQAPDSQSKIVSSPEPAPAALQRASSGTLSMEDEMAVLEALSEEFPDEASDILADDELLDELATLDELEISLPASTQAG